MNDLPYQEIPAPPDTYSVGTVLASALDSLGFRYRWSTDGLTERELGYRPAEGCRSGLETLAHIHEVLRFAHTAFTGERYVRSEPDSSLAFEEVREKTLDTIQEISDRLKKMSEDEFDQLCIRFQSRGKNLEFPFWNVINGPLVDAIYHVGQIVSFRRATGNPIDPNIHRYLEKFGGVPEGKHQVDGEEVDFGRREARVM